jgi:hypothetical protein
VFKHPVTAFVVEMLLLYEQIAEDQIECDPAPVVLLDHCRKGFLGLPGIYGVRPATRPLHSEVMVENAQLDVVDPEVVQNVFYRRDEWESRYGPPNVPVFESRIVIGHIDTPSTLRTHFREPGEPPPATTPGNDGPSLLEL